MITWQCIVCFILTYKAWYLFYTLNEIFQKIVKAKKKKTKHVMNT